MTVRKRVRCGLTPAGTLAAGAVVLVGCGSFGDLFRGQDEAPLPGTRISVLTLEEAVYKMAGFPAKRLNLKNRGLLKEGLVADVTVFDPDTVVDNATFEDPHQFPTGIPYVVVNGQVAVDHERCTGVLAGQAVP